MIIYFPFAFQSIAIPHHVFVFFFFKDASIYLKVKDIEREGKTERGRENANPSAHAPLQGCNGRRGTRAEAAAH